MQQELSVCTECFRVVAEEHENRAYGRVDRELENLISQMLQIETMRSERLKGEAAWRPETVSKQIR